MRHLRSDFDAIQPWPTKRPHIARGPDGPYVVESVAGEVMAEPLIPDDEPVFLLRAKDPAAPMAVEIWATLVAKQGGDPELVDRVRRWAAEMNMYRLEHYPEKTVADVPEGMLR